MKKILNTAFVYTVFGLIAGVFTREFYRFHNFVGHSMLDVLHTHLLVLGMMFMLIVGLFYKQYDLDGNKKFKTFFILYNVGLPVVVVMMLIRGMTQVFQLDLARSVDFSIAGIAGLSHFVLAGAIIHFFLALKDKI